jgi:flavin-dependent dehydrogenase
LLYFRGFAVGSEEFEVIVVGGGPAGTATAITLAALGRRVCVFERSSYDQARVGETLPPECRAALGALGAWERFEAQRPASSAGIVSLWGGDEPYVNDFIRNPYGPGWHVERCRFDRLLSNLAEERGAVLRLRSFVRSCVRDHRNSWIVEADSLRGRSTARSRFLVDATGRGSPPRGDQPLPRRSTDRLTGHVTVAAARTAESRTWIEACEGGWWYAATVPGGSIVVVFLTDADLLAPATAAKEWARRLDETSHIQRLIDPTVPGNPVRRVAANSYIRLPAACKDRLAVGDAAAAYDPLSGRGVLQALDSGRAAAQAVDSALAGDVAGITAFADRTSQDFKDFERARLYYYSRERRWPAAEFWRRRRPERQGWPLTSAGLGFPT